MRTALIVLLNLLLSCLCATVLIQDYQMVGRFRWYDPKAVEAGEEFYFNIWAVVLLGLALVTTVMQITRHYWSRHALLRGIQAISYLIHAGLLFMGGLALGFLLLVAIPKTFESQMAWDLWDVLSLALAGIASFSLMLLAYLLAREVITR